MTTRDKIIDRFLTALEALAEQAKAELFAQGHKATGRGINSIEAKITTADLDRLVGVILANDYLVGPVDKGVPAARVPFGGRGGGGKSKYISGLMAWARVVKPGLNAKERKSFVFAVAATHKREGIPTRGSFSFSSNGRRRDWIEYGIARNADTVEQTLIAADFVATSFEESIARASSS